MTNTLLLVKNKLMFDYNLQHSVLFLFFFGNMGRRAPKRTKRKHKERSIPKFGDLKTKFCLPKEQSQTDKPQMLLKEISHLIGLSIDMRQGNSRASINFFLHPTKHKLRINFNYKFF